MTVRDTIERGDRMITKIKKRDGRVVHFDINKIANAIEKSFAATSGAKDYTVCLELAQQIIFLSSKYPLLR